MNNLIPKVILNHLFNSSSKGKTTCTA